MKLMKDVVLVLLAPTQTVSEGNIILVATAPVPTYGRVRQIGPTVQDVQPGDMVAFDSTVGEPWDVDGYPHLLVRESQLTALIEKTL